MISVKADVRVKSSTVKVASKVKKKLQSVVDKINNKGPTFFRKGIHDSLMADHRTAKYAYLFVGNQYVKAEKRDISNPKVGGGLKFRFENNQLNVRFIMTEDNLKESYWPLMIAQYGRKGLPSRSRAQGPWVMGIHESQLYERKGQKIFPEYKPKIPNARSIGGGYYAVFTYGSIAPVQPFHKWMDSGKESAKKEFLKYARSKM